MNICVQNVSKTINRNLVLDKVSLNLSSGRITGLKGVNGSGKSMLLRTICGLIKPDSGKILFDNLELHKDIEFPKSIGILIDGPAFLDNYSAFENLKFLSMVKKKIGDTEIHSILSEVQLDETKKKKYRYFSLGMKQRLGIAAAVMEHPDIILIDEPTNALDSAGVEMIKRILIQECARGALIVLTCHDYQILKELANEIYFIEDGKVIGFEDYSEEK